MKKSMLHVTVEPLETVIVLRHGAVEAVLGPGKHRIGWGRDVVVVETGERLTSLSPQDVPTADQLTVRASVAIRWRVVDAVAWYTGAEQPADMLYLAAQVALRDEMTQLAVEDVARTMRGEAMAARLLDAVQAQVARLGIEVLQVVVKDVVLPSDVRSAIAQAVVAKHQGQAKLEAARAETAALRSLANAAKLLDDHPALARLKMVEAASFGSKIVVKAD